MEYMLMMYETEAGFKARNDASNTEYWPSWMAYVEALRASGKMKSGNPLEPGHTATTIRTKAGKKLVQDGPVSESKEQLGGYFVIEAENLDAALEWAAKCPAAAYGAVEVRPLMARQMPSP